ncbi:unnamed protein product [Blepharisma stoltei]|uniref:Folate receptor-like domain-containing protein n=1 Tax=Blepharisma stoltei TaxID=1481888 RepID=A0AAU9K8F6_9CILI|nr:unnamed protein product [Blepharisma stoltei]
MFLILLIGAVFAYNCTLLPGSDSRDPNPSLVKCYRQNGSSCCVSAHDQHIQSVYGQIFPDQCQREYGWMEDYFCFGCHPSQGKHTDEANMTVTLCKGYAEDIWGGDLSKRTKKYDNCGMYTYWRANPQTVIPSLEWDNAYEFFDEVKPPYFENYTILISEKVCFDSGWGVQLNWALLCVWVWILNF